MRKRRDRRISVEFLEPRLCLAASLGWDGEGQGSADLFYRIGDIPDQLDEQEVVGAIESALQVWSDVADITFTQAEGSGRRSDTIDFSFGRIDGAGRALAQAYLPDDVNPRGIAGDVEFDIAESWEVGNDRGSAAFDLKLVAVHEIGHALGLNHHEAFGAVMRSSVSPRQEFTRLAAEDVDDILRLYAAARPSSPPTVTAPTIIAPTAEAAPVAPSPDASASDPPEDDTPAMDGGADSDGATVPRDDTPASPTNALPDDTDVLQPTGDSSSQDHSNPDTPSLDAPRSDDNDPHMGNDPHVGNGRRAGEDDCLEEKCPEEDDNLQVDEDDQADEESEDSSGSDSGQNGPNDHASDRMPRDAEPNERDHGHAGSNERPAVPTRQFTPRPRFALHHVGMWRMLRMLTAWLWR